MEVNDFLEHHGVKGMRWGVRKKSTGPKSQDHLDAQSLKRRHISTLSNQELKKLNERRNLEKNYSNLNPNAVNRGERFLKRFVGASSVGAGAYALATTHGRTLQELGRRFIHQFDGLDLSTFARTDT